MGKTIVKVKRNCSYCKGTGEIKELIGYSDPIDYNRYKIVSCHFCGGTGTVEVEKEIDDEQGRYTT